MLAGKSLLEQQANDMRDLQTQAEASRKEAELSRQRFEESQRKHDELFRQHIRIRLSNDELRSAFGRWERTAAQATEAIAAAAADAVGDEDPLPSSPSSQAACFKALRIILTEAQHLRVRQSLGVQEVSSF